MSRPLGAAAGLVADRLFGEPPVEPHPVAAFGLVMQQIEAILWADSRARGILHAGIGLVIGASAGRLARSTAVATYVAVAGRQLGQAATEVGAALDAGDLSAARAALPTLVGRDPTDLDESEIARAVVESVAENTVDAVVAPALWASVAGAPGVLAHRAANTMDAMVGHRSERYLDYGWAAARLDDAMAWLPARATAALVAAVRPGRAGAVVRAVLHDAPAHPSPNAGVAEAAFAAALGVRLGGVSRYGERFEHRPPLGAGGPVVVGDIARAVRLAGDVGVALTAGLVAVGLARR